MTARRFEVPQCKFDIDGDRIVTDGTIHEKISGTSFGAILGHNPWISPFEVSCRLLGLIEEVGVSEKPAVHAGQVLEVPIIKYLDATYKNRFIPDEELNICAPREGPHSTWKSDWDDDVFAGHIDGVVIDEDADETRILEIKTAKDLTAWENGIPMHYQDQVKLYNWFLTRMPTAFVGLGIMNDEAYKDPESWTPCKDNVVVFEMDTDMSGMDQVIEYARCWYNTYIMHDTTVPYNPNNARDVEIMDFLTSVNTPADDMMKAIDDLARLEAEIEDYDKVIEETRKDAEALRKSIKDHMVTNQVSSMESATHAYVVTIRQQTRKSIDEGKMKEAGIDPEQFRKTTTSNVFSIKARK